jgi:hypothetical protein
MTPPDYLLDENLRGPLDDAIRDHNRKPGIDPLLILRMVGPYPGAGPPPRHRNETFRAIWD